MLKRVQHDNEDTFPITPDTAPSCSSQRSSTVWPARRLLLAAVAVIVLLVARPDAAVAQDPIDVSLPEVSGEPGEAVLIPVEVSDLSGHDVIAYGFTVSFDPDIVELTGVVADGTLTDEMLVEANSPEPGRLKVGAATSTALSGDGTLVLLEADVAAAGESRLEWHSFEFNDGSLPVQLTDGSVAAPGVNAPPTVAAPLAGRSRTLADGTFDVDLSGVFTDADGDDLTYTATSSDEAVATVETSESTLTLTPVAEGATTIEVTAADGRGGSATDAFELQVTIANSPPVAADDEAATDEDVAVAIDMLANDSDPNGDALTVSQVGDPGNGSVSIDEDGTVRYEPEADFSGTDAFTYTASDGQGVTDDATVTVTVEPVNDAPVFMDEPVLVVPDVEAEIEVEGDPETPLEVVWRSAEDPEDDSLTYRWQLALTDDFSTLLVNQSAQGGTQLEVTYRALVDRLDEHGVEAGDRVAVFHRVQASDGDLTTMSGATRFFLTRDVLTATEQDEVPASVALAQNYPNPFNPQTTIRYELPRAAEVTLRVYDALGREVATLVDTRQPAGRYETSFDARSLPSGIYLYRLEADDRSAIRRMVLAR